MLRLAQSREYFPTFFLPMILSAFVSVPNQMVDAEIPLQMGFRSLTRFLHVHGFMGGRQHPR